MRQDNNIDVNLKQFSAATMAAIALTTTATACAVDPAGKQAREISSPVDSLTIWADPDQPSMHVPSIWNLVVYRLVDVKEEYSAYYYGAALIKDTVEPTTEEPCFALLSKKDKQGRIGAQMLSRHSNAFASSTQPLDKDAFTTWILTNGLDCAAAARTLR